MDYYVEKTENMADLLFHCHEQTLDPHTSTLPHLHDWVELLYCTGGGLKAFLERSETELGEGDLMLIPAGAVHRTSCAGEKSSRYIVIKFSPELLFSLSAENDYEYLLPLLIKGYAPTYLFKKERLLSGGVSALPERMLGEYNGKAYAYRLALRADACFLILFILRELRGLSGEKRGSRPLPDTAAGNAAHLRRVFDVIVYIQKNYAQPITLEEMAKRCHVSYSYFSRQLSGVTGQSFASFLCSVRLSAAEHLLITTDISITEVAFRVGFSDASYFTRRFSEKNGMTPGAYRKRFSVAAGIADV